jgi:translation initiation factor IF-1
MPGECAFQVEGVVTEVRSARTGLVRLANGHVLFGFVTGRDAGKVQLTAGMTVKLQLTPYDLSEGRIVVDQKTI